MITQLLSISVLYVLAWDPYGIIVMIQLFKNSEQLAIILSTYFVYLPYLQSLLLPYSCILFIPDAKKKILALFTVFKFGRVKVRQNRVDTVASRLATGAT